MHRALWHLVWTGEARRDDFLPIRAANLVSGLSLGYLETDPSIGLWHATERLDPTAFDRPESGVRSEQWSRLLLRRWGVVCREVLRRETAAPNWRALRQALDRLVLHGVARRGTFVEGLSSPQSSCQTPRSASPPRLRPATTTR